MAVRATVNFFLHPFLATGITHCFFVTTFNQSAPNRNYHTRYGCFLELDLTPNRFARTLSPPYGRVSGGPFPEKKRVAD